MSLYSGAALRASRGRNLQVQLASGRNGAFVLSGLRPDGRHPDPRAAENAVFRQHSFGKHGFQVEIQGPLAGNGKPLSFGIEAAY